MVLLVTRALAVTAAAAAVGDSSGVAAHGVNLADLNLSIDRLTSKLERLSVSCRRVIHTTAARRFMLPGK